jgi:hypothetical protein
VDTALEEMEALLSEVSHGTGAVRSAGEASSTDSAPASSDAPSAEPSAGSGAASAGAGESDGGILPVERPAAIAPDNRALADEEIAAVLDDLPSLEEPSAPAKDSGSTLKQGTGSASDGEPVEPEPGTGSERLGEGASDRVKAARRALLTSPLWVLLGICWVIDLPFSWMSPSLKEKLAYLGVATALMAGVAWGLVFLRHG